MSCKKPSKGRFLNNGNSTTQSSIIITEMSREPSGTSLTNQLPRICYANIQQNQMSSKLDDPITYRVLCQCPSNSIIPNHHPSCIASMSGKLHYPCTRLTLHQYQRQVNSLKLCIIAITNNPPRITPIRHESATHYTH